ncbi:MAG: metallophosphoesterase family protein [Ignavibacteriales bacterium]|nr:metallophosphoesterase family protein [Ignavibacteriales bacterium]
MNRSYKYTKSTIYLAQFSLFILLISCSNRPTTVKEVMDNVVTRFYKNLSDDQLSKLDEEQILKLLSEDEIEVLSNQYWKFDVNVPVVISIMQDEQQKDDPFWLEKTGFNKTDLIVKNEYNTYNVWQKEYDVGNVNLGINGFDKHRPHYFVSIMPQKKNTNLVLSNIYPENQYVSTMDVGYFTYHDWDELTLTEVPDELKGGKLLTTIRGRAREAHLINAFRKTEYPSSNIPDQIMLTWSEDPSTTQSIQWRTNTSVKNGVIKYWEKEKSNEKEYLEQKAELKVIEDRLLRNDRYINHFTSVLRNLKPSTIYNYQVGNPEQNVWSEIAEFKTAPDSSAPFSFIYFGDTHKSNEFGQLINSAFQRYPQAAFYSIGGDLVSTGLNRDDWDKLFYNSANVIRNRPLMSTLGNHDSQDGLGSWMYQELFDLPKNGPEKLETETTYSFEYSNSLFLMLDVTASITDQTKWLEDQLKNSDKTWKFAMLHFPPYSYEEDYSLIRKEWGSLFDKYHVDIVFSGHVHYYMRSKPMYNEKPVKSPNDGTIYLISIAVPNRHREMPEKEFVEVRFDGDYLYQHISVSDNKLEFKAINQNGILKDNFTIEK